MNPPPTWDQYMAPSVRVLLDGEVHRARHIVNQAADLLGVSEAQRQLLIPSGQLQYVNRGMWALSYLCRADAIERPQRGHYRITETGRRLLAEHPEAITEKDLRALSGNPTATQTWKAFAAKDEAVAPPPTYSPASSAPGSPGAALAMASGTSADIEDSRLDPDEQIEAGIARIHADVAAELLTRILDQEPVFFEQAVLDLLLAMGYGGAEGTAKRTQLSGDGGIDGVIDQDALGLSRIYVQAKRYAPGNGVGREVIQAFVGALAGNQANQGVFITTSRFTRGAISYTEHLPTRVILVDGERLTRLMIRYGVGVQTKRTVNIVQIDEDFFDQP